VCDALQIGVGVGVAAEQAFDLDVAARVSELQMVSRGSDQTSPPYEDLVVEVRTAHTDYGYDLLHSARVPLDCHEDVAETKAPVGHLSEHTGSGAD
jgi:hypothetical protein